MQFLVLVIASIIACCFVLREDIMYSTRISPFVRGTLLTISSLILLSAPVWAIAFAYISFTMSVNDWGYVVGVLAILAAIGDIVYFVGFIVKVNEAKKVRKHLLEDEQQRLSMNEQFNNNQEEYKLGPGRIAFIIFLLLVAIAFVVLIDLI